MMAKTGAGIGVGADQKVKTGAETRIEATAMAETTVSALATQEVMLLVEQMVDLGYVGRRDEQGLCPNCGALLRGSDLCPGCGMELGEVADQLDDSDDAEMLRDEDIPPAREEQDEGETFAEVTPDERFMEALLSVGWSRDDAEAGGLLLARVWDAWLEDGDNKILRADEDGKMIIEAMVVEGITRTLTSRQAKALVDRVLQPPAIGAVTRAFQDALEEESRKEPPPAEILIGRNGLGDWDVRVTDPLQDLLIWQRDGRVSVTNKFRPTVEQFTTLLDVRRRRLEKLGRLLLVKRSAFFAAEDRERADMALFSRLAQKEVADGTDIKETTLSGWCNEKRVWVQTPFGPFALKDFFQPDHKRQVEKWIEDALRDAQCPKSLNPGKRNKFVKERLQSYGVIIRVSSNGEDVQERARDDGSDEESVVLAWDTLRKKITEVEKRLNGSSESQW